MTATILLGCVYSLKSKMISDATNRREIELIMAAIMSYLNQLVPLLNLFTKSMLGLQVTICAYGLLTPTIAIKSCTPVVLVYVT